MLGKVSPGLKKRKATSAVPRFCRGLDFRRNQSAPRCSRAIARRDGIAIRSGPIAKVSSDDRGGSVARSDQGRPRGAVEPVRAVSDQTAFRFPVSPGGFSANVGLSIGEERIGRVPWSSLRGILPLQAQHKVRELLRPLLRLGRLTFRNRRSLRENREGERDRDQHVRGSVREGEGSGKSNRGGQSGALNRLVLPRAGAVRKAGAHMCRMRILRCGMSSSDSRLPRVLARMLLIAWDCSLRCSIGDSTPASNCV